MKLSELCKLHTVAVILWHGNDPVLHDMILQRALVGPYIMCSSLHIDLLVPVINQSVWAKL